MRWENNRLMPDVNYDVACGIWRMALEGSTQWGIAKSLTARTIPTPKVRMIWSATTVGSILTNLVYAGVVEALKAEGGGPPKAQEVHLRQQQQPASPSGRESAPGGTRLGSNCDRVGVPISPGMAATQPELRHQEYQAKRVLDEWPNPVRPLREGLHGSDPGQPCVLLLSRQSQGLDGGEAPHLIASFHRKRRSPSPPLQRKYVPELLPASNSPSDISAAGGADCPLCICVPVCPV